MANSPDDRRYTKTHEWARKNNVIIEVGITDFAQHQLSDITYVELPAVNTRVTAGKEMTVVESIKAAADVYAPVSGTIIETNPGLAENPAVINSDPYGAGWLVKIKPDNPGEFEQLMSADDYKAQAGKG